MIKRCLLEMNPAAAFCRFCFHRLSGFLIRSSARCLLPLISSCIFAPSPNNSVFLSSVSICCHVEPWLFTSHSSLLPSARVFFFPLFLNECLHFSTLHNHISLKGKLLFFKKKQQLIFTLNIIALKKATGIFFADLFMVINAEARGFGMRLINYTAGDILQMPCITRRA